MVRAEPRRMDALKGRLWDNEKAYKLSAEAVRIAIS